MAKPRKPRKPHPRVLLVEGKEDELVIPHFMENFIPWGEWDEPDKWPAQIIEFGGIEPLLDSDIIGVELKVSGLKALGVMVDADSDPASRFRRIRDRVVKTFPTIPLELPAAGLIMVNEEGLRFGVWLMPNCTSEGMLETFLSLFVDNSTSNLWSVVETHCREAKDKHSAPYKETHRDKSRIHAWLALQDPPGQQLHSAIMQNILVPNSPQAGPFVNWFCDLFEVSRVGSDL